MPAAAWMSTLTAFVLTAFVGYTAAWYLGFVQGSLSLLIMLSTGLTGAYWLLDKLVFVPQRKRAAQQLQAQYQAQAQNQSDAASLSEQQAREKAAYQKLLMQPWWLDWTAGLFPVILVVFVLRSFFFEPFKIPSGSMIPTLRVGDLILVSKFHYGLRLPVFHTKIFANNLPQRGDVMVFRYPPQPSLDYIKRVVGLPGDEIAYLNKQLIINGQPVPRNAQPEFFDSDAMRYASQFRESLGTHHYKVLNDDDRPAYIPGAFEFEHKDACRYTIEGVVCKVPAGHYFMMGDNRDNSMDSRYWGFVPEANIVGKAVFVWMNFGDLGRIGTFE